MRVMIRHDSNASNAWTPSGFDEILQHYPKTDWPPIAEPLDLSAEFRNAWDAEIPARPDAETAIVLTPGLFAEWLPTCFRAARREFSRAGHRVRISHVRSSRGVFDQTEILISEIRSWLSTNERFIWCGHSKGCFELLRALELDPSLRERCIAAIVVQPPVGISHVLKSLQAEDAAFGQRLTNRVLNTRAFHNGVRDISVSRDPALTNWLTEFRPGVPTVCVVSWSVEPSSWIDSWHRTLSRACPGIAHDGQFLTTDQLLPETPVIMLPRIDHAQPVLGGRGFDPGRFWRTLAGVAVSPALQ